MRLEADRAGPDRVGREGVTAVGEETCPGSASALS
jgi:hypothetical protein